DLETNKDNKAILSVNIDSMEINYEKYRDLILGPVFFDFSNHPLGLLDTKKFSYKNEKDLKLEVELTIKGISKMVNTKLKIERLTSDIVQIKGKLQFNRNDFNIGTGSWKNTSFLKNKIKIETNIFLIREEN
ncbi:YceI family protein, partial [Pelagibacteraceae bacterium]|nr:YceI family protein [Pelagibacteraceae bacterium]